MRGFRIELGEIEAALAAAPGGARGRRRWRARTSPGDRRLVAYVVADEAGDASSRRELREHLRDARCRSTWCPPAFVPLDALPLTPNGKVDRRALPRAGRRHAADRERRTSRRARPIEEALAASVAEVLGVERVGVARRLLRARRPLAARHAADLAGPRTLRRGAAAARLFEAPTVARLAARGRRGARRGAGHAEPRPALVAGRPRRAAAALVRQERLWFLDQLEPAQRDLQHPRARARCAARSTSAALRRALERDRAPPRGAAHRRSRCADGRAGAGDRGPRRPSRCRRIDLEAVPEAERARAAQATGAQREALRPVRPRARPAAARTAAAARAPTSTCCCSPCTTSSPTAGRSACSCASWRRSTRRRSPASRPPLPALPVQYADYAAWQRELAARASVLERAARLLARAARRAPPPVLELPTDRPRPAGADHRGGRRNGVAAARSWRLICTRSARSEGATLFMTLLAGFQALLAATPARTTSSSARRSPAAPGPRSRG